MAKLRDWIDERTGYRSLLHVLVLLNFPVSRAAGWRYIWGGALALMFGVELITGTLLMTVYSPSEAAAWGSVQYLENETTWGGFIRQVHHHTSHLMLILIVLHGVSVIVTAGYRRPKEFTYWTGLVLAGLVLGLAISGNPLPWDQKGYWAYQIETGIAGTMPGIGQALKTLLVGRSEFGNLTLTRLYTLHVIVLPMLALILLVVHVALMRREKLQLLSRLADQGNLSPEAAPGGMEPYWPFQTTRNLLVFAILMGLIVAQIVLEPTWRGSLSADELTNWEPDLPAAEVSLQAPADRDLSYIARPEWYVRFLFELRHLVDKRQEVLVTGALPMLAVLLLFLMPFFEKLLGRRLGYLLSVVLVVGGLGAAGYLTYIGYQKDLHDPEFQQARQRELNYASRALWLARQNGIPPEGPVTLLHSDAKAKGSLLFAAHCATCHLWNGHDGTGKIPREVVDGRKRPVTPTAADLFEFGKAGWITAFLQAPGDDRFFGQTDRLTGGERLKNGAMAKWAEENLAPNGPITPEHLAAVAALVAREADRSDDAQPDAKMLESGVAVFSGDVLDAKGEPVEFAHCLQCHSLKAGDPDGLGSGGILPALELDRYGSKAWLKDFLRNPGDKRFYGKKNIMPAFDESRLTEKELELLVDWMRSDWQRQKNPSP
ncbi:MAG: cytochrome b N-terminal domain-containing protein [Planctomycetales bacterium]